MERQTPAEFVLRPITEEGIVDVFSHVCLSMASKFMSNCLSIKVYPSIHFRSKLDDSYFLLYIFFNVFVFRVIFHTFVVVC